MSKLNYINIGSDVPQIHKNDLGADQVAVAGYNETIRLATDVKDAGTRDLLDSILNEEEGHIDELEAQLQQIGDIGVQNYMTEQIG